ncbi:MAG: hypothetical protein AAB583_02895 [Patescibacteria group bacterium]
MKKSSITLLIFIGTILILSVVQGGVSNKLSTKGILVGKIEEEINYYKTQNTILSEEFLSRSSLTNLASKASELGFAKVGQPFILNSSTPLAVRQ